MSKHRATDVGLDVAKFVGEQAQSRIDRVNRQVQDAQARADAINERTGGGAFDAFGRERQRVAEELTHNPPHKVATAVKASALLAAAALLLQKKFQKD